MRIVGIDPGLRGAAAVVEQHGRRFDSNEQPHKLISAIELPTTGEDWRRRIDPRALRDWLQLHEPAVAIIERAQAFPDQGASGGFTYGRAVGYLEATALLVVDHLKTVEVVKWKRAFGLGGGIQSKEAARLLAIRTFPAQANLFQLKKDHQLAEAALIALFGAQTL